MIIRVEPKDWSMYSVLMYFDANTPDKEDESIKKYLTENRLEPKRQTKQQLEDREFDIMSFGGCYLGPRHMNTMAEIQRSYVEKELLVEAIPFLLKDGPDSEARRAVSDMSDDVLAISLDQLVEKLHAPSSFGQDEEGFLKVMLDAEIVQQSFLDLLKANQND